MVKFDEWQLLRSTWPLVRLVTMKPELVTEKLFVLCFMTHVYCSLLLVVSASSYCLCSGKQRNKLFFQVIHNTLFEISGFRALTPQLQL